MNEKILLSDLPEHQRRAVMNGESAYHDNRVVTRADVETKEEHDDRIAREKAQAEEAAKVVDGGVAARLASGDLVPRGELDKVNAKLADLESRLNAMGQPTTGANVVTDGPATTPPDGLSEMKINDLRDLAKNEGVTLDGNTKDEVIAAIREHRAKTDGGV